MPDALSIVATIIAVLLWFVWKQLEQIAIFLRKLHEEAVKRRQ